MASVAAARSEARAENAIALPILVFDFDDAVDGQAVEMVNFNLPPDFVQESGTELELVVFNLHHGNTAAVRVGAGERRLIRQGTVTILENLLNNHSAGDGYLGDFPMKRLRVPIDSGALVGGTNTLAFEFIAPWSEGFDRKGIRYEQDHHASAGYRVLYWNLVRSDGSRVFEERDYVVRDYAAFEQPEGGDAARGRELWEDDSILISSAGNRSPKRTACFDCHGSGAPLHYYRFENEVITARAMFHGLDEAQGLDIAAYIRSLAPAQSSTNAFPWSLPYQPGPKLAELSTKDWAAGEMKSHPVVPSLRIPDVLGTAHDHRHEIYGETVEPADLHYSTSVDREWKTRIHFQLPSYHQWVADVHPKEFMGDRSAWDASTLKEKTAAFRDHFTSAESNARALYKWQELDLFSYRFIQREMIRHFGTDYFSGDQAIFPYSVKKLAAIQALDMELTWDLSTVDLYPEIDTDNSREYLNAAVYFNTSPLQSRVATRREGHAIGNRTIASKRFLDVGWYALQLFANPYMGGDNRFIDSGRSYFYGSVKDWLDNLPDGEDESMFAFLVMLNNCLMRQCQVTTDVNDRIGGRYLPHYNPQVLTGHGMQNIDQGTDAQTLPMLLVAIDNFLDFVDEIDVATWQTANVVSNVTSGARHTPYRDDTKQLLIWYELAWNLRRNWGVSQDNPTYRRFIAKASAIWPLQADWP